MASIEMLESMNEFEQEHDIHIYACRDFGSRAKDLDGPNSDKDALFLFDQSPRSHKRIDDYVDTIVTEKNDIDFHGWSTRKFATLVNKSNPTAIEWLNSPEKYYEWHQVTPFLREIQHHATDNFRPLSLYYHYRDLAKKLYNKNVLHDDETPSKTTAKKMMIILRSIACAEYIRENIKFPPLSIDTLVDDESLESEVTEHIDTVRLLIASSADGKQAVVGNDYSDFIEPWFENTPDEERLSINGIDLSQCNQFIDKVTDVHANRY